MFGNVQSVDPGNIKSICLLREMSEVWLYIAIQLENFSEFERSYKICEMIYKDFRN